MIRRISAIERAETGLRGTPEVGQLLELDSEGRYGNGLLRHFDSGRADDRGTVLERSDSPDGELRENVAELVLGLARERHDRDPASPQIVDRRSRLYSQHPSVVEECPIEVGEDRTEAHGVSNLERPSGE